MSTVHTTRALRHPLRNGPGGELATVDDSDAIAQALRLLLATRPGERVMRPEYGCHLDRLVFAPNDSSTAGLAMHYVRRAIERWEPRVEVTDVRAAPGDDRAGVLHIVVQYRERRTGAVEAMTHTLDLDGPTGREVSR